jgi:hypothetical protein
LRAAAHPAPQDKLGAKRPDLICGVRIGVYIGL